MKKLAAVTLSLFMVSAPVFADTSKDANAQPATAPGAAKAAKAKPAKAGGPKAAKNAEKTN